MNSLLAYQRKRLGLSTTEIGHRLGVSQSSVVRLEQSETAETISIASLKKAAEALGCKLSYALTPMPNVKPKKSYSGLTRYRRSESKRTTSQISNELKNDTETSSRTLTPAQRIEQSCSLSDLAKELRTCSKKR